MNTENSAPVIAAACPKCGKQFRMRVELAGRTATCPCGFQFKIPQPAWAMPGTKGHTREDKVATAAGVPAHTPGALGDADFEVPTAAPAGETGSPDSRIPNPDSRPVLATLPDGPQGHAATRVSPVLAALLEREDEVRESPWRNIHVPALSLIAGQSIAVFLWMYWMHGWPARFSAVAAALTVQTLIFLPVMVATLFMAARWLDMPLGPFRGTLTKAAAVTLGLTAVADVLFTANLVLVDFEWSLLVAGFGYYLILTGFLIAFLFEVGVRETAFLIAVNFLPRTVAVYIAATYLRQSNLFG